MVKIFISHSSQDHELAEALVDLLRSALNLKAAEIRCTSADGHRLPGGADTDEALRREILEVPVFIGLISEASVGSAYVLLELGARWGSRKYLVPLLATGDEVSVSIGPIARWSALRCDQAPQLHQLIQEVSKELELGHDPPAAYEKHLRRVLTSQGKKGKSGESASSLPVSGNRHSDTGRSIDSEAGRLDVSSSRKAKSFEFFILGGACLLVGALLSLAMFETVTVENTSLMLISLILSALLGWLFYQICRVMLRKLHQ